jgi:ADP-ribosylation factor-like protein 6
MIKKFQVSGGATATLNNYTDEISDLVMTTPFLNVEKIALPSTQEQCIVYDLSGQGRYREQWQYFYPDVDAVFYVVDSTDLERISINQEILHEMARHPGLQGRRIPFIIMGNK